MSWALRVKTIEVGDRVCYSRTFLQSTRQYTGDSPQARSDVTTLIPLGDTTFAEIENTPDLPGRVNVARVVLASS